MPSYRVVRNHYLTIRDEVTVEAPGKYQAQVLAEDTETYPVPHETVMYSRTSAQSAEKIKGEPHGQ